MIPDYPMSRVETYLAAILGQDAALPTPQTRSDLFWANLAGGTWALPEPQSREEIFLAYILGDDSLTLPTPQSRVELFLAKVAGMDVELPEPASREELYLAEWVEEGGGVYRTVSGNPVLFTAKQAAALKSLMIDVQPVQSGSGDPSPDNVRPISGFSAVNVWQTGKNLYHKESYNAISGTAVMFNGVKSSTSDKKKERGDYLFAGVTYYFYANLGTSKQWNITYARSGSTSLGSLCNNATRTKWEGTFTPNYSDYYCFWLYSSQGWSDWDMDDIVWSFEVGTSYSASPPSTKTAVPVTIPTPPGTVYGGTLDLVSGVLTVTMGQIASYAGETIGEPWLSSMDVYVPGTTPTAGAQVVHTLAEPQTYQLTAQEVSALIGGNTVWTDAGQVTVEYRWN